MNRLKILLMCFCLILSATLPAAGSDSDDVNQNSTISDEVTTPDIKQDVEESSQELNEETEEEPVIIPEQEPEITECPYVKDESEIPAESEIKDEANTYPATEEKTCSEQEESKCPIITKESEPEKVCPVTEEKEECPVIAEPEKTCQKPVTEPICSIKSTVSDSKCSKTPDPVSKSTCPAPKPEKVCPVKTETKPTCPSTDKPEVPKPSCQKVITETPKPTCPKVINPEPKEPEDKIIPNVPVIVPDEPEPETPSVTPDEPDDSVKITTVKLCRDNICTVGAAGNILYITNYGNAKDPTYAELIEFLKADKTDEKLYTSTYQCGDFAKTLHDNAEKAGIKAGWIGANGCEHAFNIFNTTDKGLVYIDCTGVPGGSTLQDKQLNCVVGKPLTGTYLFRNGIPSDMGCTVTSLLTYW